MIDKKLKVVFALLMGLTLLVAFQNCSGPLSFSALDLKSEANGNGTGYDGKATYVNHGKCNDSNQLQIKGVIEVSSDGTMAVVRENCVDYPVPVSAETSAVKKAHTDPTVFVHRKEIYDLYSTPNRKLTRALCWATVGAYRQETSVWYYGDALLLNSMSPALSAQMVSTSGETTGVLSPVSENCNVTASKVTYKASSGAGDSLDLTIMVSGTMTIGYYSYQYSGYTSYPTQTPDCYLQAPLF